jgi:hypothetical protein
MLPLICFNCDGIGNFASKFTYSKNKGSDEEEDTKKKKKNQKGDKRRNKNKFFKKILYSKEDNSSSDEDGDSDSCCATYMFSIMHSLIINPGFVINRVTRHQ